MSDFKYLGKYEITGVLGKGAMGVVYSGIDAKLRREVAIKTILKSELVSKEISDEYSLRFETEAQAVAKLNHPNIVTIFDFGEEGEVAYLVMEFIRGKELKHYLVDGQPHSLKDGVELMLQLLAAMQHAHDKGIIHRDIKPANIMIDEVGRLKLTDFGVARVTEDSERTRMGTRVGTLSYMSPEQIQGLKIDARADIFAAGVVFYQILTGQRPFTGSDWAIQNNIINSHPLAPSTLNPELPLEIDLLIKKSLEKLPENRFKSSLEFANELTKLIEPKNENAEETRLYSSYDVDQTIFVNSKHGAKFLDATTGNLTKNLNATNKKNSIQGNEPSFIKSDDTHSNNILEESPEYDLFDSLDKAVKKTTKEKNEYTERKPPKKTLFTIAILLFISILGIIFWLLLVPKTPVEEVSNDQNNNQLKPSLKLPSTTVIKNSNISKKQEDAINEQRLNQDSNIDSVISTGLNEQQIVTSPEGVFRSIHSRGMINKSVELLTNKKRYKISDSNNVNDYVDITIKSKTDGYLYLLMLGSDTKEIVFILPNEIQRDNKISKGNVVKIKSKIIAAGPAGTDHLLALISENKHDLSTLNLEQSGPYHIVKTTAEALKKIEDLFITPSNQYSADLINIEEY